MLEEKLKKVLRKNHPEDSTFVVGDVVVGKDLFIAAGPCAVESEEQMLASARLARDGGANILRAGAFKPRTCPYDFQGMGEEGLRLLALAKKETGLPIVTEITSSSNIHLFEKYGVDVYQIGSRNCQNYELLKDVGKVGKPVILKRGFSTTLKEFLGCAEYLMEHGTDKVILCERGIKTFNDSSDYRNTLDYNAVIRLREYTHLPIIVDPSHGTGVRSMITRASMAGIAAGAQGLIIELHYKPEVALCDGEQSITNLTPIKEKCELIYKVA